MSRFRCPLFGQGDDGIDAALESPDGGIPLSHAELIPEGSNTLGGYYPLSVPRDQMAAFQADFSIPSVARWFWRVRKWLCEISFSAPGAAVSGSFEMDGLADDNNPFADEHQLHSPLHGFNAHYRTWSGRNDLGTGPTGSDYILGTLAIGSFNALNGADSPPSLNQLFLERTNGNFMPRILVQVSVNVDEGVDQVLVTASSKNPTPTGGDIEWTLTLDGLLVPSVTYNPPFGGAVSLIVTLTPSLFWSWDGIWDTATGEALSNPRIPDDPDEP